MLTGVMASLALDSRVLDRARISRDARFDGKFFIAVKTTGIYCRPICPSRTSHSRNVRYYATAAEAAEAGFRPCLRCRPEAAPGTPAWLGTSALVRRALRMIDEGALDRWSVEELAERLGVGARHLHRLFLQHVGASPITLAQTRRLHFAKRLLDETNLSITEIAMASGFGSIRRFNSAFREVYERSPRELRRTNGSIGSHEEGDILLKLAYRPPYDWTHLIGFLRARAVAGVECVEANAYWRTVETKEGESVICVRSSEDEDALLLRVSGAAPSALLQIASTARRVFDVAADPARTSRALESDSLLNPLVRSAPGLRIPGSWDAFECAVCAVVGQQVSVAAGRTLTARLVQRAGRKVRTALSGLTHLFPDARELACADLSGLGLTTKRINALKRLALAVIHGNLDFSGDIDEVKIALMQVPGVGEWTAEYVALRALGAPDGFPAGDLVLRRVAGRGCSLSQRELQGRAEAWRPWRGYAALYLWRAAA
jgi:AraC family transcriptional regulator of adaptative response / DNA-3-methyladenine glycosylase II